VAETLRVDFATLENLQHSLALLAGSFERMHEQREELDHIWGTREMRHAMGEFADNWTTHRDKLSKKIEELTDYCEGTLRTFHEVDVAIALAFGPPADGPR
jgi:hypothetical protein